MPTKIPEQLKEVANQVSQGSERSETVRTLLSWFDSERRGYWVVHEIRKALRKVRVKTVPDFEEAWIDAPIKFLAKPKKEKALLLENLNRFPKRRRRVLKPRMKRRSRRSTLMAFIAGSRSASWQQRTRRRCASLPTRTYQRR